MVDISLLNLGPEAVQRFMTEHPNVRESTIVADAHGLNTASNWINPIYHQVR